jgi:hypothetical protein
MRSRYRRCDSLRRISSQLLSETYSPMRLNWSVQSLRLSPHASLKTMKSCAKWLDLPNVILVSEDDVRAHLSGSDRREAAGESAADHEDVRCNRLI